MVEIYILQATLLVDEYLTDRQDSSSCREIKPFENWVPAALPYLRGKKEDPSFINNLPPINVNEGNINLLNISNCKQPKTESELSKQLLSNFQQLLSNSQAEKSYECKQVEAEKKNGAAYMSEKKKI